MNARLRSDADAAELEAKKQRLQDYASAVRSTSAYVNAPREADIRAELKRLREVAEAEEINAAATKTRLAEIKAGYSRIYGEDGSLATEAPSAFETARLAGIKFADDVKAHLDDLAGTISEVTGLLGGLFGPLVQFVRENLGIIELSLILFGASTGNLSAVLAALGLSIANMNEPGSFSPIEDFLGLTNKPKTAERPAKPSPNAVWVPLGPAGPAHWRIPPGDEGRTPIEGGRAAGGPIGTRGPALFRGGEKGFEFVLSNPAVRALMDLNRSPVQALAAVASGGGMADRGVLHIDRLTIEMDGEKVTDLVDKRLAWRRRT